MGFSLAFKGLILFSHLHPCLPSGLFIQGFPTKVLCFPPSLSDIPDVVSVWSFLI
jgi:hypothetical protein